MAASRCFESAMARLANQARIGTAMVAAPISTIVWVLVTSSNRGSGATTDRPFESLTSGSGAWTLTSGAAAGILICVLHLGQGPVLPANFSLTRNDALQPGQITGIGMSRTRRWRKATLLWP